MQEVENKNNVDNKYDHYYCKLLDHKNRRELNKTYQLDHDDNAIGMAAVL